MDISTKELQPTQEVLKNDVWYRPFYKLHQSELKTSIIKKTCTLEDGTHITFFLHDMAFPENVSATPKRKSLVVVIDGNDPSFEISTRIATRPNTVFIGIPETNTKDGKILFEEWEKENPDRDDKANPFTLTYIELDQLEVKPKQI